NNLKGAQSGADGRFAVVDLAKGSVTVEADHSVYGYASAGPFILQSGQETLVTLQLEDGAFILGTVRWDTGAPAAGAVVTGARANQQKRETRTASDGSYRLGPFGAGAISVSAAREGGRSFVGQPMHAWEATVEVQKNEQRPGVDLVLGSHEISGIVIDADG